MTRRDTPAKKSGKGIRKVELPPDPGGYVECQACGTVMVGAVILCSSCGSGAMLTRQDWDDQSPFKRKERDR